MSFEHEYTSILIIDDEEHIRNSCETTLRMEKYEQIVLSANAREVLELLETTRIGVVLLDLNMPQMSGEELLEEISRRHPEIPVIIITGNNTIESAVQCMKWGAFDYLVKPFERERLVATVRNAFRLRNLSRENALLKKQLLQGELNNPDAFSDIITMNPELLAIFGYLEALGSSSQSILITGETGVGKELIAGAVHQLSQKKGDFVTVNVAGLDENLFSDTLFGHAKGAFTGADARRTGMVENAEGGTLFLDEIGDLGLNSQVKLLRLLQEREYLPLGVDQPRKTNARMVLATNCDINAMQETGQFRKDLYYRLISHHVHIPPLRERREDIPLLVDHLVTQAAKELGRPKPTWPGGLIELLKSYHFPGNVRELGAMVYRAMNLKGQNQLSMESFHKHMGVHGGSERPGRKKEVNGGPGIIFGDQLPVMNEMKGLLIDEAMKRSKGKKTQAAAMIGVSRQSLIIYEKRKA